MGRARTHHNPIDFGGICESVVSIQGFFAQGKSNADGSLVGAVNGETSEHTIDVIHCWDHCCEIWRAPREERHRVLENLLRDLSESMSLTRVGHALFLAAWGLVADGLSEALCGLGDGRICFFFV